MNFYIRYVLMILHVQYEESYWEQCRQSDIFWMHIFRSIDNKKDQ